MREEDTLSTLHDKWTEKCQKSWAEFTSANTTAAGDEIIKGRADGP